MTQEFRLDMRFRNNLVLEAMQENGIESIAELGRRMRSNGSRFHTSKLYTLINLREAPTDHLGNWRPIAFRLAEVLKRLPEDLFTPEQEQIALANNRASIKVSFEEVRMLLEHRAGGQSPEALAHAGELREKIRVALGQLSAREERVLRLRFGIGGIGEHSLPQVAKLMGSSKQGIQYTERRAIERLRRSRRGQNPLVTFSNKPQPRIGILDDEVFEAMQTS